MQNGELRACAGCDFNFNVTRLSVNVGHLTRGRDKSMMYVVKCETMLRINSS